MHRTAVFIRINVAIFIKINRMSVFEEHTHNRLTFNDIHHHHLVESDIGVGIDRPRYRLDVISHAIDRNHGDIGVMHCIADIHNLMIHNVFIDKTMFVCTDEIQLNAFQRMINMFLMGKIPKAGNRSDCQNPT